MKNKATIILVSLMLSATSIASAASFGVVDRTWYLQDKSGQIITCKGSTEILGSAKLGAPIYADGITKSSAPVDIIRTDTELQILANYSTGFYKSTRVVNTNYNTQTAESHAKLSSSSWLVKHYTGESIHACVKNGKFVQGYTRMQGGL
jgi:hypothetical protein